MAPPKQAKTAMVRIRATDKTRLEDHAERLNLSVVDTMGKLLDRLDAGTFARGGPVPGPRPFTTVAERVARPADVQTRFKK